MVYIGRNGQVLEHRPWSLGRIMEIITGFFMLILTFFRTMFKPLFGEISDNRRWSGGAGGGGGGWSGGGGGGGGNGGGGRGNGRHSGPAPWPSRRIGRIQNAPSCNVPGGGCCG